MKLSDLQAAAERTGRGAAFARLNAGKTDAKKPAKRRGMNGWEREYAEMLDVGKRLGSVKWWSYEPFRLRLDDPSSKNRRVYYRIDFLVQFMDGTFHAIEIKGHERQASTLRFKLAAAALPWAVFRMARKSKDGWEVIRELNAD